MKHNVQLFGALVFGCVVAVALASVATLAARTFWPAYAAAFPHKHYTGAMLVARLSAGLLSAACAALATTALAADNDRAGWWLGILFVAVSVPGHLYPGYVWRDYPVWYHLIYLGYLLPVTVLASRLFRQWRARRGAAR